MVLNNLLTGAIVMASLTVALFFFRFWRSTQDRFFLYFALAFLIEGFNRLNLNLSGYVREDIPVFYLVRLLSYGLILLAIWDKNRPPRRPSASEKLSERD
jgi:hypothetical protein